MRMKKLTILAAVAAIAATACTKTFEVQPTPETPIGFGTWTNYLTKTEARVQGTNEFRAGDTFAVYGYKHRAEGAPTDVTVFDDVVATASGNPVDSWAYTGGTKFWDVNYDSYTFFAISPSAIGVEADNTNSSTDVNAQTGAFVSRAITFAGNDNDILVADKTTVLKSTGAPNYFNNYGTVTLQFNHVAALVDIKVKKSHTLANTPVTVSAFSLQNIESAGQLTVSDAYTNGHPVPTWSSTATTSYGPGSGVTPVSIASPIVIAEDNTFPGNNASYVPNASTDIVTSLIVKPQTFGATGVAESQKIVMTYYVDGVRYDATLYLADFDFIDNTAQAADYVGGWAYGKHYVFYITIDAHAISFSASITPWTTTNANGYHHLLN